jgi:hypothetical protein
MQLSRAGRRTDWQLGVVVQRMKRYLWWMALERWMRMNQQEGSHYTQT